MFFLNKNLSLRVGADDYSLEDFDDSWDNKLSEIRQMDRDRVKRHEKFYTSITFVSSI